ncbi:MAG: hypothetical protein AAF488_01625 [Planctomycetota bacterium]
MRETPWEWVFTTWVLLSGPTVLAQTAAVPAESRREIETALVERRHSDAIEASDRLISERPNSWAAHRLWSRVRRMSGRDPLHDAGDDPTRVAIARAESDPKRSTEELRGILTGDPESLLARQQLLELAFERSDFGEVETHLTQLEGRTTDPALTVYRARAAIAANRTDRAHALAQSATRAQPEDPWAWATLAEIELLRDQAVAAESALEPLRYLAGTSPTTYRLRVEVGLRFGKFEEASKAADAAADVYPDAPEMSALAARVALSRDRFEAAKRVVVGTPPTDAWKNRPDVWAELVARTGWGLRDRDLLADGLRLWPEDQPGRGLYDGYLAYLDQDLEAARAALEPLAGEDRNRLRSLVSVLEQEEEKQQQGSAFNGLLGAVIAVALLGIGLLIVLSRRGESR